MLAARGQVQALMTQAAGRLQAEAVNLDPQSPETSLDALFSTVDSEVN